MTERSFGHERGSGLPAGMPPDGADGASAATIDWLLEPENPSVRFLTLTALLGRSARHPEARAARAAIMRIGVVPALLARQEPAGHWRKPESFYRAKYRGTVWQLVILAEHLADAATHACAAPASSCSQTARIPRAADSLSAGRSARREDSRAA